MNFENKVILITGSSQGIGKALAKLLLEHGAKVCINGRDEYKLRQAVEDLGNWKQNLQAVCCDVSTADGSQLLVKDCVERFKRIDVAVCNAGMSAYGNLEQTKTSVIKQVIDSNLTASAMVSHFCIPHLIKTKGSLLFISSLAGLHGLGGYSLYSAVKMAYTGLSQSLQKELKRQGVHVGVIYLGFTANESSKRTLNPDGNLEPVPERKQFKLATRDEVALLIIKCISKRKEVVIHTPIGSITYWLSRHTPTIIGWLLQRVYWKNFQN